MHGRLDDALTDGHQAGVTARGRGVDAERTLHQQAFQQEVGFPAREALHRNNGAAALRNLLAQGAQLVGIAVVNDGIKPTLSCCASAFAKWMRAETAFGSCLARSRCSASSGHSAPLPTASTAASWTSASCSLSATHSTRSRGISV